MAVFTDSAGAFDLTITTPGHWTITDPAMPNGDACVHGGSAIDPTYNTSGSSFNFGTGDWTIELCLYIPVGDGGNKMIIQNTKAAPVATNNEVHWQLYKAGSPNGAITFMMGNTASGTYAGRVTPIIAQGIWHHVVVSKPSGAVPTINVDRELLSASSTSPTGTPVTPTSFRLSFGVDVNGGQDSNGLRFAKLAIYNRLLTDAEIMEHYIRMMAT